MQVNLDDERRSGGHTATAGDAVLVLENRTTTKFVCLWPLSRDILAVALTLASRRPDLGFGLERCDFMYIAYISTMALRSQN